MKRSCTALLSTHCLPQAIQPMHICCVSRCLLTAHNQPIGQHSSLGDRRILQISSEALMGDPALPLHAQHPQAAISQHPLTRHSRKWQPTCPRFKMPGPCSGLAIPWPAHTTETQHSAKPNEQRPHNISLAVKPLDPKGLETRNTYQLIPERVPHAQQTIMTR